MSDTGSLGDAEELLPKFLLSLSRDPVGGQLERALIVKLVHAMT